MGAPLIKSSLAITGSISIYLFQGTSPILHLLIILTVIEYLSYLTLKVATNTFSCKESYIHIARKILIFAFVAVSCYLDQILDLNNILLNTTIIFYIINELLASIENAEKLGVPVPKVVKEAVERLKKGFINGKKEK